MPKTPEFENAGVVTVVWDESLQAVVVTWHGGATPQEFDALLEAEVLAIRKHGAVNLLADCRLQRPLDTDAQDRADQSWVPRVIASGLKRMAIVLPREREAAVNLLDRLGQVNRDELEVRFFEGPERAADWFQTVRA